MVNTCNAWIAIEPKPSTGNPSFPGCLLKLNGSPNLLPDGADGDWILAVTPECDFTRTGRVLRLRGGGSSNCFSVISLRACREGLLHLFFPAGQVEVLPAG